MDPFTPESRVSSLSPVSRRTQTARVPDTFLGSVRGLVVGSLTTGPSGARRGSVLEVSGTLDHTPSPPEDSLFDTTPFLLFLDARTVRVAEDTRTEGASFTGTGTPFPSSNSGSPRITSVGVHG